MSGYLGTKAVLLSTTTANVGGDSTIGGDLTVDTNTLYVDSTNNRVGIGNAAPTQALDVTGDIVTSGGVYLGGTGSDNYLDDYEEGTWTPSAYQGSISFASAWYIKVGNLVTVGANVYNFSDTTTANGVGIKDLPFTSASSATATGAIIGKNIASSTGYSAYIGTSEVAVYFYEAPESSNTYEIMKHNDLTSASDFHFCITYKSA